MKRKVNNRSLDLTSNYFTDSAALRAEMSPEFDGNAGDELPDTIDEKYPLYIGINLKEQGKNKDACIWLRPEDAALLRDFITNTLKEAGHKEAGKNS
ncbi:MAG: hypothetical protein LBJ63_12055 [Prevotellaceae bacterium]|jgi:hypothetical protein|nr:hypothetical protein [Prevotellaceae bacterium]